MFNKAFTNQVDNLISGINSIPIEKLKPYNIDYLQTQMLGNNLFILSSFPSAYMCDLSDVSGKFKFIKFPNIVFRCFAIIVIDMVRVKYKTHRIYTFPINIDLYDGRKYRKLTSKFEEVINIIKGGGLEFNHTSSIEITHSGFGMALPTHRHGSITSKRYKTTVDRSFSFEIDKYMKNHVILTDKNKLLFRDPYYTTYGIKKDSVLDMIECTCTKKRIDLKHACYSCKSRDDRYDCSKSHFHTEKCECGDYTYLSKSYKCLKCAINYNTGDYTKINDNDELTNLSYINNFVGEVPFLHQNQSDGGLCLGGGKDVINTLISDNINPIRLMLAFKANMAYTDQSTTNTYYKKHKGVLLKDHFEKYVDYYNYLYNISKYNVAMKNHIFSLYCYCRECLFYRVCLFLENKLLNRRALEITKSHFVSRDKFIKIYKYYLDKNKEKVSSTMHKIIETVINIPPIEFLE